MLLRRFIPAHWKMQMTELARPDDPTALADAEAPLAEADRWLARDLEAMARRMGQGDNYWSLQAAGLNPKKSFFAVWLWIYETNREMLKGLGLPTTKVELSSKIGVSRVTLDQWAASDWYRETGFPVIIRLKFDGLIFKAIDRLEKNIDDESGHVSNQSIKLVFDYWQALQGIGKPETAIQINVVNEQVDRDLTRIYGDYGHSGT